MSNFEEGYNYFEQLIGASAGTDAGSNYVQGIEEEIQQLIKSLNNFEGYQTNVGALKGDIAEFWHAGTFNINAIARDSSNRAMVDRSHDFASADISSNFGKRFGLKYYKTAEDSAKQQSKSVYERYMEYEAQGGKESYEEFLKNRQLTEPMNNSPIYEGQTRIIPKDQLEEAKKWLEEKIQKEKVSRPEQVYKYEETLKMLNDKLEDMEGTESIPLSKDEAENLARLAKNGEISEEVLKDLGVSTEEIIKFDYIMQESFKAGISAATISMILKLAPEIYKTIQMLIENGEIDNEQYKSIGLAAISGGAEGFLRGSIASALTIACKSGMYGDIAKNINPSVIGASTVIVINTMKNSIKLVKNEMQPREVTNELLRELFVSTCSLSLGGITQAIIEIPMLGYMLGSFLGSMAGTIIYDNCYNKVISFCIDTGFTMFGLVEQDYELPKDVINKLGIETFEYETFEYETFEYETFEHETFECDTFEIESYDNGQNDNVPFIFLRRGVIGVNKIGYC